jgi:hypothetical protein
MYTIQIPRNKLSYFPLIRKTRIIPIFSIHTVPCSHFWLPLWYLHTFLDILLRKFLNYLRHWPTETINKKTNIDQQNITQKTRYRATLMAIKTVDKRRWYKMVIGSCSTSVNPRVTVKRQEHHLISKSYWTPVVVS